MISDALRSFLAAAHETAAERDRLRAEVERLTKACEAADVETRRWRDRHVIISERLRAVEATQAALRAEKVELVAALKDAEPSAIVTAI